MTPEHLFVPVPHQTGCARCGYARGHHPNRLTPPTLVAPSAEETRLEYGLRVLRHCLACHSCPVAGPSAVSDDDLALADQAAQYYATHATGPDPDHRDRLEAYQLTILRQYSNARHMIAHALTLRRTWAVRETVGAPIIPIGGAQPGRPAPLQPTPTQRPPGGSYADSRPTLSDRAPAGSLAGSIAF